MRATNFSGLSEEPFWQSAQKDLFAMIRQLGIPTWFCSFSSADMRWPEMLNAMLRQERKQVNLEDLSWQQKCSLLKCNPVTAARMFDYRWHCFLRDVLQSPAAPIGKITDYFYRVEFQMRGSPHIHALFWVDKAPKIDKDSDAKVVEFCDKYVTCQMPSDPELLDLIDVQKHSEYHAKSCDQNNAKKKKKGEILCRFNFPRPVSERTFITRPGIDAEFKGQQETGSEKSEGEILEQPDIRPVGMTTESVQKLFEQMKTVLSNREHRQKFHTAEEFFQHFGISQEMFQKANCLLTKRTSIVLQRKPQDVWINQYNPDLLRCWQANMDIQFVVDAYSCVVYIISYALKTEREMGLLLDQAQKEAMNGNLQAKESMKKIGTVFLQSRQVSAQECCYRLTGLPLKHCSRGTQFIPTGEHPVRMSVPLSQLKQQRDNSQTDDQHLWMKNIVDRYKNRPDTPPFLNMCLATFASEYRVLPKSQIPKGDNNNVIQLKNNFGFITKRTNEEKPAMIRYVRLSPIKQSEAYHQSIL